MKITHNEDGTVTVAVPQAPEFYDESDGALYVRETLTESAFSAVLNPQDPEAEDDGETPADPA